MMKWFRVLVLNMLVKKWAIVRIVNRPLKSTTLDVTVVPRTKSIGIQVGSPSPELDKRHGIAPVVTPAADPPLKSYWTHRVNLPYPPAYTPEHQSAVGVPYMPQQQQQYQYNQPTYVPTFQPPTFQPFVPNFGRAVSFVSAPFGHSEQPNRRQRRNFVKHQKYLQRKQLWFHFKLPSLL